MEFFQILAIVGVAALVLDAVIVAFIAGAERHHKNGGR